MMKYRYEKNHNGFYKIIETYTDYIIKDNISLTDAQKHCKHLNRGGGFFGFTPSFFLPSLT